MRLNRLYLVNPLQYPCVEATARAAGADDVLANAQVVQTLPEALEGCTKVYGTSARLRSQRWPIVHPRAAAAELAAESLSGEVALVFGRERSGLSNEEMGYCHKLIHIPVNPDYSSLNLAAAVQVLSYELNCLRDVPLVPPEPLKEGEQPAAVDNVERFYDHLEEMLVQVGYHDPANPRHLIPRLRRLFNKAEMTEVEVRILRGILREIMESCPAAKPHQPEE